MIENVIRVAVVVTLVGTPLFSQMIVNAGIFNNTPIGENFRSRNNTSASFDAGIWFRTSCCLWWGFSVNYSPYSKNNSVSPASFYFRDNSSLSSSVRWFAKDPEKLPLYIQGSIMLNEVTPTLDDPLVVVTPDLRRSSINALGAKTALGYLFLYKHCASYFFDASIGFCYTNLLFRGTNVPVLPVLSTGLTFNYML